MEGRTDLEQFEEQALDVVRKAEESALEAGRKWAKTVGDMVPVELPLARQVVKEAIDFTEEVLRLQREFVGDILKTVHSAATPRRRPGTHRRATTTHATHSAPAKTVQRAS